VALGFAVLALLAALAGQAFAGWHDFNNDQLRHQSPAISFGRYVVSSEFGRAILENWQSEFLAVGSMAIFRRLPAPAGLAGVQTGRGRARRYEPDRIRTQVAGGRRAPRVGLTCLPVGNP